MSTLDLALDAVRPRITLGELAHARLREAILSTRLRPGMPISENELAEAIGVSRTPVREAIRRLVEERLVEVTPQQGTIVARIDPARARQAVFLRRTIECAVLERAAPLDEVALAGLADEVERHRQAITRHDTLAAAGLDDAFHARLMSVCGCPEATVATTAISGDITRILFLSGADETYYASVARDHAELVELLRAHRLAAALDLLGRHIGGFAIDQDRLRHHAADLFTAG